MKITLQIILVAMAACLCAVEGAPDGRLRNKQRPTRGFKNVEMMTARGFGKRDRPSARTEHYDEFRAKRPSFSAGNRVLIARGFGKRDGTAKDGGYGLDNFWESLEMTPERDGQDSDEKTGIESIPIDWFVSEILNNPDLARSVVRKFIDVNQDGMLTADELLRNVYV